MINKVCEDCKWYLPPNEDGSRKEKDLAEYAVEQKLLPCGFCVRYPPVRTWHSDSFKSGWALVQENDWCGEFAEKQ